MKQTKLWLTTIAALLCSLTANAHDFEVGGIYYTITSSADLTVKVTYRGNYSDSYSNEYSGAVTIPSTVTYNSKSYSVTSIGNYAFYECSSLTTIILPEGVTSIGERAFSGCSSLTSITLPDGMTSIEYCAFSGCSSLTSITLPEGVTSIGEWAFSDCSSLTSITLSESVTSIGNGAFEDCSSLTAVHISSIEAWCKISFEDYDSNPLYYAHNLYLNGELVTELVIPESVTSIGNYAF